MRSARRLIGLTLILSSVLLQIGYAAQTTTQITNQTKLFQISVAQVDIEEHKGDIDVQSQILDQGKGMSLKVNNLHPGASFKVKAHLTNTGSLPAEVESISLRQTGTVTPQSTQLYQHLKGYDKQGDTYTPEAYETFLRNTYTKQVIHPGETFLLSFGMTLGEMETQMQALQTQFELNFTFIQQTNPPDPPDPDPDPNPDPQDPLDPTGPTDPIGPPEPEITLPESKIPGGPTEIPKEEIRPNIDLPDDKLEIELADPDIPGGKLPKTGGIAPSLVYGLGILMLGSGVILYRKK